MFELDGNRNQGTDAGHGGVNNVHLGQRRSKREKPVVEPMIAGCHIGEGEGRVWIAAVSGSAWEAVLGFLDKSVPDGRRAERLVKVVVEKEAIHAMHGGGQVLGVPLVCKQLVEK